MSLCSGCFKNVGSKKCSRCGKGSYCSKACISKDMPLHRKICTSPAFGKIPVEFQELIEEKKDEFGTWLEAKKDIGKGRTLLIDTPVFLVIGLAEGQIGEDGNYLLTGQHEQAQMDAAGIAFSNDPKFEGLNDFFLKLLVQAAAYAPWLAGQTQLRLLWDPRNGNPEIPHCKKIKIVSDEVLHSLLGRKDAKGMKGMYAEDLYKMAYFLGSSFTSVYSMTKSCNIASGLFNNAWRVHESCAPNTTSIYSAGKLYLIASKDIKVGEKITVGYHPNILLYKFENRSKLIGLTYGVEKCVCDRCTSERQEEKKDVPVEAEEKPVQEEPKPKERTPEQVKQDKFYDYIDDLTQASLKTDDKGVADLEFFLKCAEKWVDYKEQILGDTENYLLYMSKILPLYEETLRSENFYPRFENIVHLTSKMKALTNASRDAELTRLVKENDEEKITKAKEEIKIEKDKEDMLTSISGYNYKLFFFMILSHYSAIEPENFGDMVLAEKAENNGRSQLLTKATMITGLINSLYRCLPKGSFDLEVAVNGFHREWKKMLEFYTGKQ